MDRVDYAKVVKRVIDEKFEFKCGTVSFVKDDSLFILSDDLSFGVPRFVVKVNENLKFSCFHLVVQISIPSLTKNRITILNSWFAIEEVIDHLIQHKKTKKFKVLYQQIQVMGPVKVGTKLYDPDIVVRAFEYFATSRSFYSKHHGDYQFPSIRALTNITSAIASKDDSSFLKGIFKPLTPKQRSGVIMQDEVLSQEVTGLSRRNDFR